MSDLTLPAGYTRLGRARFQQVFTGGMVETLLAHTARQTGIAPDRLLYVTAEVDRMEAEGKIAFAQTPTLEPAVFAAPRETMTPQEGAMADALVSYFDSTGSFKSQTGEMRPDTSEAEDIATARAQLAALQADIGAAKADLAVAQTEYDEKKVVFFRDYLKPPDAEGLVILSAKTGVTPSKFVDLYLDARAHAPTLTVEAFIKMAARRWMEHAVTEGHETTSTAQAFLSRLSQGYRSTLIDRVLALRAQFAQHPLAKDLSFGQQAALAFLADQLQQAPDTLLQTFHQWRDAHPGADAGDFFSDFVTNARQRAEVSEEYVWFREEMQTRLGDAEAFTANLLKEATALVAELHAQKAQLQPLADSALVGGLSSDDVPDATARVTLARELEFRGHAVGRFLDLLGSETDFGHSIRLAQYATAQHLSPEGVMDAWVDAYRADPACTLDALLQRIEAPPLEQWPAPPPGAPVFKVPPATLEEWLTEEYPDAIEQLSRACTVSKRVVREILDRWYGAGVLKFIRVPTDDASRKTGTFIAGVLPEGWPAFVNRSERAISVEFQRSFGVRSLAEYEVDAKARGLDTQWDKDKKTLSVQHRVASAPGQIGSKVEGTRPGEHTYMRAIEAQYGALTDLIYLANKARSEGLPPELLKYQISIGELFDDDIPALKRADTFCWFEEPVLAVQAAALTLPDSVRLTRDLTEHYACWWYFTLPPEIQTRDGSEEVQALLWSWQEDRMVLSTYVRDDRATAISGGLLPTAKFYWIEGETLAHMVRRCRAEFQTRPRAGTITEDDTVAAIERLARFFVAGALWIQQTILVQSKGSIERHLRKRIDKAKVFDRPLSDVQIIQLRRRESVTLVKSGESKTVDWKCRWIVGGATGFWRNQYYPSKGRYQPKWIAPYPKGPADKPLKVPSHRVYAVSR